MTDKQTEALKLALEALEAVRFTGDIVIVVTVEHGPVYIDRPIAAIREALAEQPAQQEVDWEKLYRLEVKKKEALAAKYERDTGKKLTRIVPMAEQPAQQEPVAWTVAGEVRNWSMDFSKYRTQHYVRPVYTSPPASKPWVGLTDAEVQWIYDNGRTPSGMIDMAEAKLREKNGGKE